MNGVPAQDAEMVFQRRMLLKCEKVMNFVMRGKCIRIEITSLRVA